MRRVELWFQQLELWTSFHGDMNGEFFENLSEDFSIILPFLASWLVPHSIFIRFDAWKKLRKQRITSESNTILIQFKLVINVRNQIRERVEEMEAWSLILFRISIKVATDFVCLSLAASNCWKKFLPVQIESLHNVKHSIRMRFETKYLASPGIATRLGTRPLQRQKEA